MPSDHACTPTCVLLPRLLWWPARNRSTAPEAMKPLFSTWVLRPRLWSRRPICTLVSSSSEPGASANTILVVPGFCCRAWFRALRVLLFMTPFSRRVLSLVMVKGAMLLIGVVLSLSQALRAARVMRIRAKRDVLVMFMLLLGIKKAHTPVTLLG